VITSSVYQNIVIASEVHLTGIYAALADNSTNFQTLMRERRAISLLSQHPETNTNPIMKEDPMNTGLHFSPSPQRHVTGNLKRNLENS